VTASCDQEWFSAKTVCKHQVVEDGALKTVFEERVVLIRAADFSEATTKGEEEVQEYCRNHPDAFYTGYIVIYWLHADRVRHGTEIFSLLRESSLADGAYLNRFYDDGNERTQQ
jgi:hypothetical protein